MTDTDKYTNAITFQVSLQVGNKTDWHREWTCNLLECCLKKSRMPISVVESRRQRSANDRGKARFGIENLYNWERKVSRYYEGMCQLGFYGYVREFRGCNQRKRWDLGGRSRYVQDLVSPLKDPLQVMFQLEVVALGLDPVSDVERRKIEKRTELPPVLRLVQAEEALGKWQAQTFITRWAAWLLSKTSHAQKPTNNALRRTNISNDCGRKVTIWLCHNYKNDTILQ